MPRQSENDRWRSRGILETGASQRDVAWRSPGKPYGICSNVINRITTSTEWPPNRDPNPSQDMWIGTTQLRCRFQTAEEAYLREQYDFVYGPSTSISRPEPETFIKYNDNVVLQRINNLSSNVDNVKKNVHERKYIL